MSRGSGRRDVLQQTTACSIQDTALFASRLQGNMEEPHGDPMDRVLPTHSLPAPRL